MIKIKSNSFIGNSFIYIIGVFLNQGINFLTLMIFARILTPENYGYIALYGLWVNICLAFISLQGASSVNNALNEFGREKLNSYLFSISLLNFFIFALTLGITLIFQNQAENIIGLSAFIIILFIIQAAISSFTSLQIENFRVRKKAVSTVIWTSITPVFRFFLSLFLIIFIFNYNYIGDIYGFFIVAVAIGLIAFCKTAVDARFKFDFKYITYCLPITVPIIFHAVSNLILAGTDRYMLDRMLSRSEMGIYSFIYNISIIPTGIWFAVNNAWTVEYFEKLKSNNVNLIKILTNRYIKYIFCIYIVVLFLLPEIVYFIATPDFYSGISYASYIMAGGFFTFLYTLCSTHEVYAKKTIYIPIATIISALINIGLNLVFIPVYGAFGAAVSTIISFMVLFFMHYIFAGIFIKGFPISFLRMILPAGIILCSAVIVNLLIDYMILRLIPVIITLIYLAVCFIKYYKNRENNDTLSNFK